MPSVKIVRPRESTSTEVMDRAISKGLRYGTTVRFVIRSMRLVTAAQKPSATNGSKVS